MTEEQTMQATQETVPDAPHPGRAACRKAYGLILATMGLALLGDVSGVYLSGGLQAEDPFAIAFICVLIELALLSSLLGGYAFGRNLAILDMGRYALSMLFTGVPGLGRAIEVARYLPGDQGAVLVLGWVSCLVAVPFAVAALVFLCSGDVSAYCKLMKEQRKAGNG